MKKLLLISSLLITGFLNLGGEVKAAFSLSGSVVTQSGTDVSLSGLSGVGTVSTFTAGNVIQYTMPYELIVQGNLTIDHNSEMLITSSTTGNTVDIQSGGVLTLGKAETSSFGAGGSVYGKGTSLVLAKGGPGCCSNGPLTVRSGGTLNQYNSTIVLNGAVDIKNGSAWNVLDGVIYSHASDGNTRIRCQEGTGMNIDGLTLYGIQFDYLTDEAFTKFEGLLGRDKGIPVENATGFVGAERIWRSVPDYRNSASAFSNNWSGQKDLKIYQSEIGSSLLIVPDNTNGHGGRIYHEWDITVTDSSSTPLPNVETYIRDTDNGNRATTTTAGTINEMADRVYQSTTDINGQLGTQEVLTGMWYRTNSVGDLSSPDGNEIIDVRGKTGVAGEDFFDIYLVSYGHLLGTISNVAMQGLQPLDLTWTLFDDANITESSKTTVDAYTEIDTFEKLYDRAKSYKVDNLEYPAIEWQVIDGNGSELDLGSKNLIVDGAAGSAFAINEGTDTVTIKASEMDCSNNTFTSLLTTGLVSFINGAAPGTCIFTDTGGTNGAIMLTGLDEASVLVYDDASVGDDTISYQTSQTGDVVISFPATTSTDYRVVVRRTGYSESNFNFDPSTGGLFQFPINQNRALTIEGTPIYQNGGDLAKITMDYPGKKINIGDFTISAQEFYDTLQDYEVTELAMKHSRISNYDGDDKILLLNAYQVRNRDGGAVVPGINAFVFTEMGGVLDNSNGSVQFLSNASATVDKQEQIIKMIQALQGSTWDDNTEVYAAPEAHFVNIAGVGFDPATDSLSNIVQSMLDTGILDVNTIKDLLE